MTSLNMTNTGLIIIAVGIVVLAWEIVAFVTKSRRALVSTWMQKFGFRAPASIFVLGMLAGHFWAYFPPSIDDEHVECPSCKKLLNLTVDSQSLDVTATVVEDASSQTQ
jgi:hypothetical protein